MRLVCFGDIPMAFRAVTGVFSVGSLSGSFNFGAGSFAGLRACDPGMPEVCDDLDGATVDTCCYTPVGACGSAVSSGPHRGRRSSSSSPEIRGFASRPSEARTTRHRAVLAARRSSSSRGPRGSALLTIPQGQGRPGWKVTTAPIRRYRFAEPEAPAGISSVRKAVLIEGKRLEVRAKATGLPLVAPQGRVSVRVTTGSRRSCARFAASSIVRDVAGAFVAKDAPATALADCSDASLR